MGKTIVKEIGVRFTMDTSSFDQNIKSIDSGLKTVKSELRAVTESLKLEWNTEKFKHGMELAAEKAKLTTDRMNELLKLQQKLNDEGVDKTADEYRNLQKEIEWAGVAVQKAAKELKAFDGLKLAHISSEINRVGTQFESTGRAMMPVSAAITAGMGLAAKAGIDMETAMTGVAKTTDMTTAELDDLQVTLLDISKTKIPVDAIGLAKIAENAGQLGIQKENIIGFTKVMANLDATTDMAGDTAAQTSAKFANITQMAQTDFDRMGSSIVALGNNSATTESSILDMGMRIAAAGTQAGMTESDILGVAAAMSSLGLEAEAGGTATSKTINTINVAVQTGAKELEDYADVAGMSAGQFKTAWETDAAHAFATFIEGIGRSGDGAAVTLERLGMDAERQGDALKRAAGSGDLFRNSLELSNRAWQENTALTTEADLRYQTTASQLQFLKNEVFALGTEVGATLIPHLREFVENGKDIAEWFENLDSGTQRTIVQFSIFAAAFGPLLTVTGKAVSAVGALVPLYGMLTKALKAKQTADVAATVSQTALNTAMAANPIGIVAAGLGVLISVVGAFAVSNAIAGEHQEDFNQTLKETMEASAASEKSIQDTLTSRKSELALVKDLIPRIEELNGKTGGNAEKQAELNGLVKQANDIVPGLISNIDSATDSYTLNKDAIYENIEALQKKYEIEANADIIKRKYSDVAEFNQKLAEAKIALAEVEAKNEETIKSSGQLKNLGIGGISAVVTYDVATKQIEEARQAISGYETEIASAKNAIELYTNTNKNLYGVLADNTSATDDNTESSEQNTKENNAGATVIEKKAYTVSQLTSELASSAKAYYDVADAQDFNATTAAGLYEQYGLLVAENSDLLQQYPELYAALDKNNAVQENAANVSRAIYGIKKQLLLNELDDQKTALDAKIKLLEAERNSAIEAYAQIGQAASIAWWQSMEGKNNANNAAIKDAKAQADAIAQTIKSLKNAPIDTYAPAKSAKSSGSSSVKTDKHVDAYEKEMAKASKVRDSFYDATKTAEDNAQIATANFYATQQRITDTYLIGNSQAVQEARGKSLRELKEYHEQVVAAEKQANAEQYNELVAAAAHRRDISTKSKADADAEYWATVSSLNDTLLDKNSEEYQKATRDYEKYLRDQLKTTREIYDEEHQSLKDLLAQNLISQEEYFQQANTLRNNTRDKNEGSFGHEDWVKAGEALYQERRQMLTDQLALDKITQEQFFDGLVAAQKEYLVSSSNEWMKLEIELYQFSKKQREAALQEAQKAYTNALKAETDEAAAALKERQSQIDRELAIEKERLNAIIQNIDAEIDERERLEASQDFEKRIDTLQTQIKYERDDENKVQLERELTRTQKEQGDWQFGQRKAEERMSAQNEIAAAEKKAGKERELAQREHDTRVNNIQIEYDAKIIALEAAHNNALVLDATEFEQHMTNLNNEHTSKLASIEEVSATASEQETRLHSERLLAIEAEHQAKIRALKAEYDYAQLLKNPKATIPLGAPTFPSNGIQTTLNTVNNASKNVSTNSTHNATYQNSNTDSRQFNVHVTQTNTVLTAHQMAKGADMIIDKLAMQLL